MLPSRRLRAPTAVAAMALVLGCARPAMAQHLIRSANIEFYASVARSDWPKAPRVYRLYEELQALEIDLTVAHRSVDVATADRTAFSEGLRIVVEREGRVVPITASGALLPAGSGPVPISLDRTVGWQRRLHRNDGMRFSTGVYTIRLSLGDALATLRLPDRTAPRSVSSELTLTVHVVPPTNEAEQLQMHRVLATHALRERRFVDATLLAKRALALEPNDLSATSILASAYLALDRCPEAAVVLETVLQKALGGRSGVPESLEFAYVCAGDEANAKRVMQMRGVRPEQLESTLDETRRRVRNRPRKD